MESTSIKHNTSSTLLLVTIGWYTQTSEDIFMEEVESYTVFKIAAFINSYWFPVLIPIGFVGNTLSFLVMIKLSNRKMSTCIYMAAISVNDNIMMCMCLYDYLVAVVQIHNWYPLECKFLIIVTLFALQNCTFQVVAMTTDKYIAIKWPHKAATYSTPRRAKIIVIFVYMFVFIYNIPHLFLSSIVGEQCLVYGISNVMARLYSWFSFVLNAIIPFTMLIHMNFIIVKSVRNSRKMFASNERRTNEGIDQRMDTRQKNLKTAENQLTVMLLLVTTLFLILLCPTYFRFIYLMLTTRDTSFEYVKSMLLFQITSKLYITNSGINFFLYCISGQKFRNDLKEILRCNDIYHHSRSRRKDDSQSTEICTVYT